MSRRKRRHLKSPRSLTVSSTSRSHSGCISHQGMHAIDSHPFHPMTILPPIPKIQFDLENSRSKVKVKDTPVSAASFWLISLVFHIRVSYWLLSLSFHDNRASHSRDTIWPSKFKVRGTPVSAASSLLISVVFHIRASYWLLSLSFHDNRASHSRDTIWPWKFKVKGEGQRYPRQRSIQMTHFLFISLQLDQPFLRYGK